MSEHSPLPDRDIATAGEYVLGTLPAAERAAFAARLAAEPALAAEVARWEAAFDPLAEGVARVAPSFGLKRRIEARLFGPGAASIGPRALGAPSAPAPGRVAGWWRWAGIGGGALAAGLAAVLLWTDPPAPKAGPLYVSDMVSADGRVRLAALYDEARAEMRVSVGGAAPAAGRDFELWLIEDGQAPVSLGVMPREGTAAMPMPEPMRAKVAAATFAITDEPLGGAPGGVATGPVVAAAPMRRI